METKTHTSIQYPQPGISHEDEIFSVYSSYKVLKNVKYKQSIWYLYHILAITQMSEWFEKEIKEEAANHEEFFFPQWQRTMKTTIALITRKYKVVQIRISYFPDPNIQYQRCQNLNDLHHFQVGLLGTIFMCLSNLILLWMSALSGEKKWRKFIESCKCAT